MDPEESVDWCRQRTMVTPAGGRRAVSPSFLALALGSALSLAPGCACTTAKKEPSHDAAVLGSANPIACSISANVELSPKIPTVAIVTWTTDLHAMDRAVIEFGLPGAAPMTAPVDLGEPDYRTLLLGMKAERGYALRIRAWSENDVCTSDDYSLTTLALPETPPSIEQTVLQPEKVSTGFIVTSAGVQGLAPTDGQTGPPVFIVDRDGDVVWSAPAPPETSRARMSWDGKDLWMMAANPDGQSGEVRRISMDGLDEQPDVPGLSRTHHDFTVLPGGSLVAIAWTDTCSALLERSSDGTVTQLIPDVASLYLPAEGDCHPNSIQYQPWSDTFTLSDRSADLFVRFTHGGELLWQLGGERPLHAHFPGDWNTNHGHHLLEGDRFVFFNNGNGLDPAVIHDIQLDETTWTTTPIWQYRSEHGSFSLGDVQRLPNGNTLVTYSNPGILHEVDPDGNLVRTITTESLGYANYRPSLYGPPPR